MNEKRKIKHALRYSLFNRLYDFVTAVTCREKHFKTMMIDTAAARIRPPVLDIACGTGTFMGMLLDRMPALEVIGLDADPNILAIAGSKIKAGGNVRYVTAYSDDTRLESASVGTAFSSLLYHHLDAETKRATTREVYRVLKKGGDYVIADWGRPDGFLMSLAFTMVRLFDGFDTTRDSLEDRVPEILGECGFKDVAERARVNTVFGTMKIWKGTKGAGA